MTGQTAEYCEDRNSPYRCLLSPSLTLSLPPPSPGLNCKTYRNTMSGFTPYPRKSLEQPLPAVNRGKSSFSLTVLSPLAHLFLVRAQICMKLFFLRRPSTVAMQALSLLVSLLYPVLLYG